jgi:hypothetical protein
MIEIADYASLFALNLIAIRLRSRNLHLFSDLLDCGIV